jgi:hypothetical protein
MKHTRVSLLCWPIIALTIVAGGCHNCDLVEAELRSRESDLLRLRGDLYRAESENAALHRELHDVRQGAGVALIPELASQTYPVRQVVLGRLTGGYDEDDCPGDEALQVVLEPRDADGHALKAPGFVRIVVLEITPEGLKAPLSSWDISPDQLRRTWRDGLLSTGYHVVLPWKAWPASNRLRVVAQFTLADGRLFEAEKDVTVHLPPAAYRKPLPRPAIREEMGPDLSVPEAPAPRPLDERKAPPAGSEGGGLSRGPVLLLKPVRLP